MGVKIRIRYLRVTHYTLLRKGGPFALLQGAAVAADDSPTGEKVPLLPGPVEGNSKAGHLSVARSGRRDREARRRP